MKIRRGKYIGLDFDNTCVVENWPDIGEELPGSISVLKELQRNGHKIILLTQREHRLDGCGDRDLLQEAVDWLEGKGINLYGINDNPELERYYNPPSRKVYSDVIIDDHSCGIRLITRRTELGGIVKCVDWDFVDTWMVESGYYKKKIL